LVELFFISKLPGFQCLLRNARMASDDMFRCGWKRISGAPRGRVGCLVGHGLGGDWFEPFDIDVVGHT